MSHSNARSAVHPQALESVHVPSLNPKPSHRVKDVFQTGHVVLQDRYEAVLRRHPDKHVGVDEVLQRPLRALLSCSRM